MTDDYRNLREDIDSAIDGELSHIRRRLNEVWFKHHEAQEQFNDVIQELWESHMTLSRMLMAENEDQLLETRTVSAAEKLEDQQR